LKQVEDAWSQVAFVNYVIGSVGLKRDGEPRPPPVSGEMWERAKEAYLPLLDKLQPRAVVVLGKTMWSWMPEVDVPLTDDVSGYRHKGGVAMCYAVRHPTGARPPMTWQELAEVIRRAREEVLR
jgi:hypothetical protein